MLSHLRVEVLERPKIIHEFLPKSICPFIPSSHRNYPKSLRLLWLIKGPNIQIKMLYKALRVSKLIWKPHILVERYLLNAFLFKYRASHAQGHTSDLVNYQYNGNTNFKDSISYNYLPRIFPLVFAP